MALPDRPSQVRFANESMLHGQPVAQPRRYASTTADVVPAPHPQPRDPAPARMYSHEPLEWQAAVAPNTPKTSMWPRSDVEDMSGMSHGAPQAPLHAAESQRRSEARHPGAVGVGVSPHAMQSADPSPRSFTTLLTSPHHLNRLINDTGIALSMHRLPGR